MKKHLKTAFTTRQYMLAEDFEVYYYDDPVFLGVAPHTHDYYEFYLFLQGDISMSIRRKPHQLKPGDVIVIPPGVSHQAKCSNPSIPYRRFILWISKDYFQQLCQLSSDYRYIISNTTQNKQYVYHNNTTNFHLIQAKMFHLLEEIHSNRFGREAKVSIGINDLILHFNRMAYDQTMPSYLQKSSSLYDNLILFIEGHLDEDLSLDRLAEVFYANKYHIAHIFKENLEMSVHQYILKKRLALCVEALLNEPTISKTFLRYGFKDYSSFYRAFKKEYGMSPQKYKELHRSRE